MMGKRLFCFDPFYDGRPDLLKNAVTAIRTSNAELELSRLHSGTTFKTLIKYGRSRSVDFTVAPHLRH